MSEPRDAIDELAELLQEAGLTVTLDVGRTIRGPCTFCGHHPEKGSTHDLWDLGHYHNGETLTRPVCHRCEPLAQAKGGRKAHA